MALYLRRFRRAATCWVSFRTVCPNGKRALHSCRSCLRPTKRSHSRCLEWRTCAKGTRALWFNEVTARMHVTRSTVMFKCFFVARARVC